MGKKATGTTKKYQHPKCPAGHDIIRVKVVRIKGRQRLEWRCRPTESAVLQEVCR